MLAGSWVKYVKPSSNKLSVKKQKTIMHTTARNQPVCYAGGDNVTNADDTATPMTCCAEVNAERATKWSVNLN